MESAKPPVYKINITKGVIGLLLSLGLTLLLFLNIEAGTILSLIQTSRPGFLVVASIIYLVTHVFRAYRFKIMFPEQQDHFNLLPLFAIVSLHNLFQHLLPFKMGEVSYLLLQKKHLEIPYSQSGASLVFARIYDLIALFLWGIILFPIFYLGHTGWTSGSFFWVGILLVVSTLLFFFLNKTAKDATILKRLQKWLASKSATSKFSQRLLTFCSNTVEHSITISREVSFVKLLTISMMFWFTFFLYFFVLFRALGFDISFPESIFPSYGAIIANLIPINGFGNFGTFEAGMTMGQMGAGIDMNLSISMAFLSHAHLIVTGALAAVFATTYLSFKK